MDLLIALGFFAGFFGLFVGVPTYLLVGLLIALWSFLDARYEINRGVFGNKQALKRAQHVIRYSWIWPVLVYQIVKETFDAE